MGTAAGSSCGKQSDSNLTSEAPTTQPFTLQWRHIRMITSKSLATQRFVSTAYPGKRRRKHWNLKLLFMWGIHKGRVMLRVSYSMASSLSVSFSYFDNQPWLFFRWLESNGWIKVHKLWGRAMVMIKLGNPSFSYQCSLKDTCPSVCGHGANIQHLVISRTSGIGFQILICARLVICFVLLWVGYCQFSPTTSFKVASLEQSKVTSLKKIAWLPNCQWNNAEAYK